MHTSRHIYCITCTCTCMYPTWIQVLHNVLKYNCTSISTLFFEVLKSKHKYPHEILKHMTPLTQLYYKQSQQLPYSGFYWRGEILANRH